MSHNKIPSKILIIIYYNIYEIYAYTQVLHYIIRKVFYSIKS